VIAKSCVLKQSPASVCAGVSRTDDFWRDFEKGVGGYSTSWWIMKLPGRSLCRCFARVVLPEHVAPLGRGDNVRFLWHCHRDCAFICAYTVCACEADQDQTYPMPTIITQVCGDPWTSCAASVVVASTGCWSVILGVTRVEWLTRELRTVQY
jgi:hypothetical protein